MRFAPLGALLLGLAGAALAAPAGAPGAPSAAAAPNVLLISIDTLRADHLGCYGYANADLARARRARGALGALRGRARADAVDAAVARRHADRPPPARARHPRQGRPDPGRRRDGRRAARARAATRAPRSSTRGKGGNVGASRGFARGFDVFEHGPHGGGGRFQHDVARTVDAGLAWLGRARSRASVLPVPAHEVGARGARRRSGGGLRALHQAARSTSRASCPAGSRASRGARASSAASATSSRSNRRLSDGRVGKDAFPPAQRAELAALYDAGIYYVDEQLGRLFAALAAQGLARGHGRARHLRPRRGVPRARVLPAPGAASTR